MGRYRFIDAEKARGTWSVRRLCSALSNSRAGYYAWRASQRRRRDEENARLTVHIRAIHRRSRQTYGSPGVTAELREQGWTVGHNRVARLMRVTGLAGLPQKRFKGSTTDSDHSHRIAPDLLPRDFTALAPNGVWVGDITYLPTRAG